MLSGSPDVKVRRAARGCATSSPPGPPHPTARSLFTGPRGFLRQLAITLAMGSASPLLLDLPAANQLAPPGFVYERRQPELGALHRAARTGWPQVKELSGQLALGYNADIGAGIGLSGLRSRGQFADRNRVMQRWNQRTRWGCRPLSVLQVPLCTPPPLPSYPRCVYLWVC